MLHGREPACLKELLRVVKADLLRILYIYIYINIYVERRDRETERQRDRETERQRDRETERQRDRDAYGRERNAEQDITRQRVHPLKAQSDSVPPSQGTE
jgi:hypothetical protein